MRQIKFRAWDKLRLEMYEIGTLDCPWIYDDIKIMQFTGLYDLHGKEIYEGDIVRYELQEGVMRQGVIEYSKNGFWLRNGYCPYNSEVIGNIYENPELMEQT